MYGLRNVMSMSLRSTRAAGTGGGGGQGALSAIGGAELGQHTALPPPPSK